MAEVIVSTTETAEQVADALQGRETAATPNPAEVRVGTTSIVDQSVGAPFTVPDGEPEPVAEKPTAVPPSDEAAKAETTAAEVEKPEGGKPRLKHNDPQKRIDQLTFKAREAERKAEELQAALRQRETELQALRTPTPAPVAAPAVADPNEPTEDQFDTYNEFIDARVAYQAAKVASATIESFQTAERDRIAREAHTRAALDLRAAHEARITEAKARYADFDEAVEHGDVSEPMADAIVRSPIGGDLAYYLGTHPEDCARIRDLHPAHALIEMGRLEARLEAQLAPASTSTPMPAKVVPMPVPRVSTAPPPIVPITGGVSASTDLDALSTRDYILRQNARDRAAGRL